MATVCVDASFVLKWFLPEEHSDCAGAALLDYQEQKVNFAAPGLLPFEIISVLRRKVYFGILLPSEADEVFSCFISMKFKLLSGSRLNRQAWQYAVYFNRPNAYDCFYLAAAKILAVGLWTADQRLYNATRDKLPWVKWVGEYGQASLT
jgi:predicted nucleic acid-binding protein